MGRKTVFSANGAGTTGYSHVRMNLDPHFPPCIKINWKSVIGLNVRTKSTQLLEENIRVNLCDLGLGNGFLPNAQATNENVGKWDFIKT